MPGGDSSGDDGGRTKVMDGSWNPRRVNCWPLHVRLGDTLALPRPRKSMHPFVLSRAPPIPSASSSSSFLHLHHYTYTATNVANPYSLSFSFCNTLLSLSRSSGGPLFFAPEKGEGVRGCRRRPATALCISHRAATNFHSFPSPLIPRPSGAPSFPFHPPFFLDATFPRFSSD